MIDNIRENFNAIIFLIAPILYFVIRDLITYQNNKKKAAKHKKDIIESEKRIFKRLQESDQAKANLVEDVQRIQKQIYSSLAEMDKAKADLKEEKNKKKKNDKEEKK